MVAEGAFGHRKLAGGGPDGQLAGSPLAVDGIEACRQGLFRTAEFHAAFPGGLDALALALADGPPFVVGNETQDAEDEVADEGAEEVFRTPRVEQGHVDDADVDAFRAREEAPHLLNLLVVPPQPIDAEHEQCVVGGEPAQQPAPGRAAEVLARLVVDEDVRCRYAQPAECGELPVLVLVLRGDACVAIDFSHDRASFFLNESMVFPIELCQWRDFLESYPERMAQSCLGRCQPRHQIAGTVPFAYAHYI